MGIKKEEFNHLEQMSVGTPIKQESSNFLVRRMNFTRLRGTVEHLENRAWGNRN